MVNTQPVPGKLRTCSLPPFASMPRQLMASPSPRPVRSAPHCVNGRKISSVFPSGNGM